MSNEDPGDRTQRPTDRRRKEARARGEVARSTDLVCALVLLATTSTLWWCGPSVGNELAALMRSGLTAPPPAAIDPQQVTAQLTHTVIRIALTICPILLVAIAAAALSNLIQSGFLWVPSAISPDADRLNPASGIARWFATSTWIGLLFSFVKLIILLLVFGGYLHLRLGSGTPLMSGTAPAITQAAAGLIGEFAVVLSVALTGLALLDYGCQFWQHERRLMMTVEEVRREQREDNGNARIKHRQRQAAASTSTAQPADVHGVAPV